MAALRNVTLNVGHVSGSSDEFAEVSYDVEFGASEIEHNFLYDEWVGLLERDGELDFFFVEVGTGTLTRINRGLLDDFIGEVFSGEVFTGPSVLRPDGRTTVHRTHRRQWPFPHNERGPEEYRALVIVTPQIWEASAWSNEVSIDLA
jgi:hypothetical protein